MGLNLPVGVDVLLSVGRSSDEWSALASEDLMNELGLPGASAGAAPDGTATEIALSAIASLPVMDGVKLYAGGGVGYYILDADISGTVDLGGTFWGISQVDVDADLDMENSIGFHVLFGAAYRLMEQLELFAEFRYAMLTLEGSLESVSVDAGVWGGMSFDQDALQAMGITDLSTEEDYAQGMLRVGANLLF
ncbi:MAG: outer membrane beta-barrel protein [Kiritimatiellae bacterium]|nr:outer membrane beta-barrel protein [Kiritimatiellia bacterium]